MNRQQIKYWFLAVLAMVACASCRKDVRTEPQDTPVNSQGETVTLSLSAEVGFDEEQSNDLKGLDFKLENVDGKAIPRPQFVNGQNVDVITVIKGGGVTYAKKMTWTYSSATKRLVLDRSNGSNSILIPNFNNDNDTKWYIAGLLVPTGACELSGTNNSKATLTPTRILKSVSGNVGDDLGKLNIPYWTGWMELLVESFPPNSRDSDNSYSNAKVQTTNAKFKPLGTLIAFKLGNKLTSGAYTFTPTGFTIGSNAYSDGVTFDFAQSSLDEALPTWTTTSTSMAYTFASGHAPGPLAHNAPPTKTYYAWVMPNEVLPATVTTSVMLKGTSSRPETATYKDYTKTYYTDYIVETKVSGGKPKQGKIQTLRANATRRLIMPIEYVTEYNLAGGPGLTHTVDPGIYNGYLGTPEVGNSQPMGVIGPLRFSNRTATNAENPTPHGNDQSGYYSGYRVMGITDPVHNSASKNLSTERLLDTNGTEIALSSKYFIPENDHLMGAFPSFSVYWYTLNQSEPLRTENIQLGYNENMYFFGRSEFSKGYSADHANQDVVIYAIRYGSASTMEPQRELRYSRQERRNFWHTYHPLKDNSLRCAYRFTRVGGTTSHWSSIDNSVRDTRLTVDVVYLGEGPSVDLTEISDQLWWDGTDPATSKRLQRGLGPVLTRVFPASGTLSRASSGYKLSFRSAGVYCITSSAEGANANFAGSVWYQGMYIGPRWLYEGCSVRLFKLNPDQ